MKEGENIMAKYELVIERVLVNKLNPDPGNARTHSHKQIKQLARSIKAFGFLIPILGNLQLIVEHPNLLF